MHEVKCISKNLAFLIAQEIEGTQQHAPQVHNDVRATFKRFFKRSLKYAKQNNNCVTILSGFSDILIYRTYSSATILHKNKYISLQ
jgi:hypothetical protein